PETKSFNAISNGLLVAPILQKLILSRYPLQALDFAQSVSELPISRIIPCHFANDLRYTGPDFLRAFGFLAPGGLTCGGPRPLEADFRQLEEAERSLVTSGAIAKEPTMLGGRGITREDVIRETENRCRKGVCTQEAKRF
ncbi:hypothetical protein TrRE_jg11143, partial [Triparma retinervis]